MNKSLLFVKAKSRLGLLNPPKGETHLNVGVESGPDYVLSQEFLSKFPDREVLTYSFSSPESVSAGKYYQRLSEEYTSIISLINSKLTATNMLVTVGGDHSISLASVAAILKSHNHDSVGLIMIDSHADLHTSVTTQTGNFHGMWMRAICDTFTIDSIDKLVPKKIPVQNILYIGNLDVESAEQDYIQANNIAVYTSDQLETNHLDKKIDDYLNSLSHIHVSIDIDGFSHIYAPATGMNIRNGLVPDSIRPLLQKLRTHSSVSADLVEVNPLLPGAAKTIQLSQQLLREILP